jgi:hypothetical protein
VRRDAALAVAIDGLGSVYSRLGDAKTAQVDFDLSVFEILACEYA